MESQEDILDSVPTFWELPIQLRVKLVKEFLSYVIKSIKFRHWVMFFSFWALAFQTDKLLDQYLIFDTVVKVDIRKPRVIDMPGVTICTDQYHMVARQKLMDRYPEIQEELDKKNLTDEKDVIKVLRRWKQYAYEHSTVDQWFRLMADPSMVLECQMIMKPIYHKDRNLTIPDCYNMSEILYTLPQGSGICWIFFSQVNPRDYHTKDWVKANDWYKIDVEAGIVASYRIHFKAFENGFVYDEMPFDYDNLDHHPELAAIVNYGKAVYPIISLDRATLKPGTNYEIQFSQTNAIMLNVPYHTDCRNYEDEGHWKQFKSNYHCIDACLQEYMSKCKCTYNVSRGERITQWPADGSWDSNVPFCNDTRMLYDKSDICRSSDAFLVEYSNSECQLRRKCKNHCYEEYYRYEVKQLFWDNDTDGEGAIQDDDDDFFYVRGLPEYKKAEEKDNFSTLRIKRKDITDLTYEHTPDMIFVEFVCYFGGLLGLWLGVSILDAYHQSLIWYAEAPGEYVKWLERQTTSSDVQRIQIEPDGRITVIKNEQILQQKKRNRSIKRMPSGNWHTEYSTSFGTQFSNNITNPTSN